MLLLQRGLDGGKAFPRAFQLRGSQSSQPQKLAYSRPPNSPMRQSGLRARAGAGANAVLNGRTAATQTPAAGFCKGAA